MKRILLISALSCSLLGFTSSEVVIPIDQSTAYVCGKSKKYHLSKSCRGLSNCKSKISSYTLSDAKKGRTLCGWED